MRREFVDVVVVEGWLDAVVRRRIGGLAAEGKTDGGLDEVTVKG